MSMLIKKNMYIKVQHFNVLPEPTEEGHFVLPVKISVTRLFMRKSLYLQELKMAVDKIKMADDNKK